jgi:RAD51-like protein 3
MPQLKHAQAAVPEIVLERLAAHQPTPITTVEDLLTRDVAQVKLALQGVCDANELIGHVARQFASPDDCSAFALFQALEMDGAVFPTGAAGLDSLIGGGVCTGEVTEFVGQSGAGKSQLCLGLAIDVAAKGFAVLYLSTSHATPPEKLIQIIKARHPEFEEPELQEVLSRIRIRCLFSIFEAVELLSDLREQLTREDAAGAYVHTLRLLLVDSVTSLVSPTLGGEKSNKLGHGLMMTIGKTLSAIAALAHVAVVVTNNSVVNMSGAYGAGGAEVFKASLGASWSYCPTVQVMIQCTVSDDQMIASLTQPRKRNRAEEGPVRMAQLTKSPRLPVGGFTTFLIGNRGCHDPVEAFVAPD